MRYGNRLTPIIRVEVSALRVTEDEILADLLYPAADVTDRPRPGAIDTSTAQPGR